MAGERETASAMFERQERERELFFVDQARRLEDAGFDWVVPKDFAERQNYGGRGLVIRDSSGEGVISQRISKVLKPDGGLVLVIASGQEISIGSFISVTGPNFFTEVEKRVNETLARLQAVTTAGSSS